MTRIAAVLILILALAACAPTFNPLPPLGTVTFQEVLKDGYATFNLATHAPLTKVYLRLPGTNLKTNTDACESVTGALQCVWSPAAGHFAVLETLSFSVSGELKIPKSGLVGVVCNDEGCYQLYVSGVGAGPPGAIATAWIGDVP